MKVSNMKLDLMLARRCKTLSDLRNVASPQTLTRIRQGMEIKPATLGRISKELECDPVDILEEVSDDRNF